jgi:hypothetical protein
MAKAMLFLVSVLFMGILFPDETESVMDPVVVLPKLQRLPMSPSQVKLGDRAPSLMERRNQCRKILSLWRKGHPEYSAYRNAKEMFDSSSLKVSELPDPLSGFEELDRLHSGLMRVSDQWTGSPAGEVYSGAAERCDRDGTVSYKVFEPPQADEEAQEAAREEEACDNMKKQLQSQLNKLLVVVKEGLHQADDDHRVAEEALQALQVQWRNSRSAIALQKAQAEAEHQLRALEPRAAALDGQGDNEAAELATFVREEIEWHSQEANLRSMESTVQKNARDAAATNKKRAEQALARRLALNATVMKATKQPRAKLGALERIAAAKGGMNKQDRLRVTELVTEVQQVRLDKWKAFAEQERSRLLAQAREQVVQLQEQVKDAQAAVDSRKEATTLLEGSHRAMRAQLSLLVSDGDRSLAARRLSVLNTRVEKARGLLQLGILSQIDTKRQLLDKERHIVTLEAEGVANATARAESVVQSLDHLEHQLKNNTTEYGAIDSARALAILRPARDALIRQMEARNTLELKHEVAVATGLVRAQEPELHALILELHKKMDLFVCGEPTFINMQDALNEARRQIEPILNRVHSSLLLGSRDMLRASEKRIAAEQVADAARKAAEKAEAAKAALEEKYAKMSAELPRARLVRRLNLQRRATLASTLQLRRAEARAAAAVKSMHTEELQRRIVRTCRLEVHLDAWNHCCHSVLTAWRWGRSEWAAVENAKQLEVSAQNLAGPEETAILAAREQRMMSAWNQSGSGLAFKEVVQHCSAPPGPQHPAHRNAERRVKYATDDLVKAKAASDAAAEEMANGQEALTQTTEGLHEAEKAGNGTISESMKQWKLVFKASKRRFQSLKGALSVANHKTAMAEKALSYATKNLNAAQEATAFLDKSAKLMKRLNQARKTTIDVRKQVTLRAQIEESKEQMFNVELARGLADRGEGASTAGVSRGDMIANYVARFQASRTKSSLQLVLTQLRDMEERARGNKVEHGALEEKITALEADIAHLKQIEMETSAVGDLKLAAVKAAGAGAVSTKQILVTTQHLLKRRAVYMQEIIDADTGAGQITEQEQADAVEELAHINDELLRVAQTQQQLAPEATARIAAEEAAAAAADPARRLGEEQNSTQQLLGEAAGARAARVKLSVSTAQVKAEQLINQLEQQVPKFKKALDDAKTEKQKQRAETDLRELEMKLEEARDKRGIIAAHAKVLDRAAKDDTLVSTAMNLKAELSDMKHQLILSAIFMKGQSSAGASTPNTTSSSGAVFQLDSLARMLANRRSRDARAQAKQMDSLLNAVDHALAAVPQSAVMRVAARRTLKRATTKTKLLRRKLKKLQDLEAPQEGSAEETARNQNIQNVLTELNKQTQLSQAAKAAIESNERAIADQAKQEQKSGGEVSCAELPSEGAREHCTALDDEVASRCGAVHHKAYEQCCRSIVQGWQWGRAKFQAYQASTLELQQEPYWEKRGTPAEQRSQLTQMQQHRKTNEVAKKRWMNSDDRKVSLMASDLCAVRAKTHEAVLEGLHKLATEIHTQQDADEPLSNVTADNVPAGTADGKTDLSQQTQSALHYQMKKATDSLQVDLQEMERKRKAEIARGLAVRAFTRTKSMLADVHKMEEGGFADAFTNFGAKKKKMAAGEPVDDPDAIIKMRRAAFERAQKKAAVEQSMESARNYEKTTEKVAKELFEIKQQPPPIAPPPEAIPPAGYIPHQTRLAYMEAKLHRSYASFLSGTHSAVLQLEKLYRASQRRTKEIADVRAGLAAEYARLEELGQSDVSDVKIEAMQLAEKVYLMMQKVETVEDEAVKKAEAQKQERAALKHRLERSREMINLATGEAPPFDEAAKQEAARNKKVADMMNKLNEAANGVVTGDAKAAFGRALDRMSHPD